MKKIDLRGKNRMLIVGGTGGTGSWFARYFKDHGFLVSVWGPSGRVDVAERLGVGFAGDLMAEVAKSDVVILSVPIKETIRVIEEVAPKMRPGKPPHGRHQPQGRADEGDDEVGSRRGRGPGNPPHVRPHHPHHPGPDGDPRPGGGKVRLLAFAD